MVEHDDSVLFRSMLDAVFLGTCGGDTEAGAEIRHNPGSRKDAQFSAVQKLEEDRL